MIQKQLISKIKILNRIVIGLFFTTIVLGFGLLVFTLKFQTLSSPENIFNGLWFRQLENSLRETSPLTREATSLWGAFEYAVFGIGRKGVLVGRNGWLYSDEEFHTSSDFEFEIQKKIQYTVGVAQQLKQRQISLVVVPIPAKARVYPEFLGSYQVPRSWKEVYSSFISSLRQNNVLVVDTLAALETAKKDGLVFLRTDTHWTPLGASVVAKSIQEVLKPIDLALTRVQTTPRKSLSKTWTGDLVKFIPLGRYGAIQPEILAVPQVEIGDTNTDLLGEAPIEVALVGTSYSANSNFGFSEALKLSLGSDVFNFALEGKGIIVPMQTFLNSPPNPLPKLVIWELPERFLPTKSKPPSS